MAVQFLQVVFPVLAFCVLLSVDHCAAECTVSEGSLVADGCERGVMVLPFNWSLTEGSDYSDCSTVQICIDPDHDACQTVTGQSGTVTFTDLIPGQMYTGTITAVAWSGGSTTDTDEASTFPMASAGTAISSTDIHPYNITMEIYKPVGVLDYYNVSHQPEGGCPIYKMAPYTGQITLHTFTDLRPGHAYSLQAWSHSNGLESPQSTGYDAVHADVIPPVSPEVVSTTSSSITVSWTAPVATYDRVIVNCTVLNGALNGTVNIPVGAGTTATCTGLSPGATYNVTLSCVLDNCCEYGSVSSATVAIPSNITLPAVGSVGFTARYRSPGTETDTMHDLGIITFNETECPPRVPAICDPTTPPMSTTTTLTTTPESTTSFTQTTTATTPDMSTATMVHTITTEGPTNESGTTRYAILSTVLTEITMTPTQEYATATNGDATITTASTQITGEITTTERMHTTAVTVPITTTSAPSTTTTVLVTTASTSTIPTTFSTTPPIITTPGSPTTTTNPSTTTVPGGTTTSATVGTSTTTAPGNTAGAVFTRWGRHVCDGGGFLYEGIMSAPGKRFNGSGSNYLCLPVTPAWANYMDGDDTTTSGRGVIYGVEYHGNPDEIFDSSNLVGTTFFEQNVPCAVCESVGSTILMIPGMRSCPGAWSMEYWGYVMADNHDTGRTEYVCMDHAPEAREGGSQPQLETSNIYHVEARCGSLPCPQYVDNREITCAVCSK